MTNCKGCGQMMTGQTCPYCAADQNGFLEDTTVAEQSVPKQSATKEEIAESERQTEPNQDAYG